MQEHVTPGPHGPLASVLEVRRGPDDAHTGGLEHREALIYTLGKAAELEHLVMLQYLFAAFSLKQDVREGVTPEQLVAIQRWRKTLLEISAQEMLHLALVQNLLTAVGAAPRFARPNFPVPAYAYPAGVRIELLQPEPEPPRHGPLPRDWTPDDPLRGARRPMAVVLSGRPPVSPRRAATGRQPS